MPMPRKPRRSCRNCGKECSRPEKFYCNNTCHQRHLHEQWVLRWKAGEENGRSGKQSISAHIRKYLHEKHDSQCEQCGWGQTHPMTGLVPLTIDHTDGDWTNNQESNLKLLCPNCHSLTPTYGSLNRGRGRGSNRKRA